MILMRNNKILVGYGTTTRHSKNQYFNFNVDQTKYSTNMYLYLCFNNKNPIDTKLSGMSPDA
jgi:hypothetical protein